MVTGSLSNLVECPRFLLVTCEAKLPVKASLSIRLLPANRGLSGSNRMMFSTAAMTLILRLSSLILRRNERGRKPDDSGYMVELYTSFQVTDYV